MLNNYGVDSSYFKKELKFLLNTIDNRTPDELYRYFLTLAAVAQPIQQKPEPTKESSGGQSFYNISKSIS